MAELSTLGHVIKEAYEGQPDTNAFTDAEKEKLANLSTVATSGSFADLTNKPPVMAIGNTVTEARDAIDAMPRPMRGAANGVAPLDASAKVPLEHLNVSGLSYLGAWDASTNSPALTDGLGSDGDFFKCSVAGTQDFGDGEYTFGVGDWVIYASGHWHRIGVHETVTSVNGKTGEVVLTAADVGARPNDWMPTAEQVGARPGNWMPSAEQVGARPSNWVPSWSQITGKPSLYSPRGTISPPIPAVYRLAGTAQSLPVSSTTKITAWTGSGYDVFGMGDGSDFTVPAWASHARLTTGVRIQHVKSAGAGHLWIAVYLDNTLMASGQTQGTDNLSYPVATAVTGIIPVTAGQKFHVRAWHNDTTAKELHLGGACYINIELFESI